MINRSENNISALAQLIEALRCLPGVGPKTARRMVLHLLERDRDGARQLAGKLVSAMDKVQHCHQCRNFTENEICEICLSRRRDGSLLCIVENPGDVLAIEQTGHYRGKYFVLMGALSPIDGIGPGELGFDLLLRRCKSTVKDTESDTALDTALDTGKTDVAEVILALSSSVEGEATSHFISELIKPSGIQVSRIAQGIPVGGELEYIDGSTLSHAFNGRKTL